MKRLYPALHTAGGLCEPPPAPSLPFSSKAFQCAHKPTSRFTVSSQNILGRGDKLPSNLCSSLCLSYTKTQRPGHSFSKKLCGLLKPVVGRITNLSQLPESYDQRCHAVMQTVPDPFPSSLYTTGETEAKTSEGLAKMINGQSQIWSQHPDSPGFSVFSNMELTCETRRT